MHASQQVNLGNVNLQTTSRPVGRSTAGRGAISNQQRRKYWLYLRRKSRQNAPLLRLPEELQWNILEHVFEGVTMVDIKITQRHTDQRRFGAQSILIVCRELREIATAAMFRYATFEIPHFKLHTKHRRENKMTTLSRIQNLTLIWTPAPRATFTTKRGDDAYILRNMPLLRTLTIWLLAAPYFRLTHIQQWEEESRVELHEAMIDKFELSIASQPRWLKRLLRDAPPNIQKSLVSFFAFGPDRNNGKDLQAAYISWPSKKVIDTEAVTWDDFQRARAGLLNKRLGRMHMRWLGNVAPMVGDRVFGRKVW